MPSRPLAIQQAIFDLFYANAGGPADFKGAAKAEYLANLSVDELLQAFAKSQPHISFAPTIDGHLLKDSPVGLPRGVKEVILGTNLREGSMFAQLFLAGGDAAGKGFIKAVQPAHHEAIWEKYPVEKHGSVFSAFDEIFNDMIFHYPAHHYSRSTSKTPTKVYRYRFEHPFASSEPLGLGVHHAAEIPFVFYQSHLLNDAERKQSEEMVRHWAHFATHGHPDAEWPAYKPVDGEVMVYGVGGGQVRKDDWRPELMEFWEGVYGVAKI